jgi:NhaP-type Na+/H+ or K+/H+ antiporter
MMRRPAVKRIEHFWNRNDYFLRLGAFALLVVCATWQIFFS